MRTRKLGLQGKWRYVIKSLEHVINSYEKGSSRISLFLDSRMRYEAVSFAIRSDDFVLDLGSGPGTMSRLIIDLGAKPILVDVSRKMLRIANFMDKVNASFEFLPFRDNSFDSIVCGFALRDAFDLKSALSEIKRVMKIDGKFAFCDLGKPDSTLKALVIAFYLRVFAPLIGLISAGRAGLSFGSLFDTYMLAPKNYELVGILKKYFKDVKLSANRMGGSIVVKCSGKA